MYADRTTRIDLRPPSPSMSRPCASSWLDHRRLQSNTFRAVSDTSTLVVSCYLSILTRHSDITENFTDKGSYLFFIFLPSPPQSTGRFILSDHLNNPSSKMSPSLPTRKTEFCFQTVRRIFYQVHTLRAVSNEPIVSKHSERSSARKISTGSFQILEPISTFPKYPFEGRQG